MTGGLRGTFKSNSSTTYKLKDPELVRECLEALSKTEGGTEDVEIPDNLFDFIIGQEELKDLFWRSIKSEHPVHVLMIGPPACSKSMFLGEISGFAKAEWTSSAMVLALNFSSFRYLKEPFNPANYLKWLGDHR